MRLDSEEQRQILLELISNVPIQGATIGSAFQGVDSLNPEVVAVISAIKQAEIADEEDDG